MMSPWASASRETSDLGSPADVFSLIESAFTSRPDAICLTEASHPDRVRRHRWQDIHAQCGRLANAYAASEITQGNGIFFLTRKSVPAITAQMAALMAGNIAVPILPITRNPREKRVRAALQDLVHKRNTLVHGGVLKDGGLLLIVDPEMRPHLTDETAGLFKHVLTLDYGGEGTLEDLAARQRSDFSRPEINPEDGTYSVFTSGSTSDIGKGVLYTQRMTATNLLILRDWLEIKPGTTALNSLQIHHIHGLMQQLFAPLVGGGHAIIMEEFEPERYAQLLGQADIASGVPITYRRFLNYLSSLNPQEALALCEHPSIFTAGSDRVWAELRRWFYEVTGKMLVVRGGSTEQQHMYGNRLNNPDMNEGIGFLFRTYEISIRDLDDPSKEVAPGEMGELCSRGPCVVKGYINNPEATAYAFMRDGFYRSGDVVRMNPENNMMIYEDRTSSFIDTPNAFWKNRAKKFSSYQVEVNFAGIPEAAHIQVVGVRDAVLHKHGHIDAQSYKSIGELVVLVIVPKVGADLGRLKAHFLEKCAQVPEPHLFPSIFIIADQLSTSVVGKIVPRHTRSALEETGTIPGLMEIHSVDYNHGRPVLAPSIIKSRSLVTHPAMRPEGNEL